MQKVRVATIKVDQGVKDGKEWTKTTITGDDGSEFAGFDTKLTQLGKGALIEVDIEVKGRYTNIKAWKLLEESPAVHTGESIEPHHDGETMLHITQMELRSQEGQVALKELGDTLRVGLLPEKDKDVLTDLYFGTIKIKLATFAGSTPSAPKPPSKPKAEEQLFPEDNQEVEEPKTLQQLLEWVAEHGKKFNRTWILTNFDITEDRLTQDISGCFHEIKTLMDW